MTAQNYITQWNADCEKHEKDFSILASHFSTECLNQVRELVILAEVDLIERNMRQHPDKESALDALRHDLRMSIRKALDTEFDIQGKEPRDIKTETQMHLLIEDVYERMAAENPNILRPLLRREVTSYVTIHTNMWSGKTILMHPSMHEPK